METAPSIYNAFDKFVRQIAAATNEKDQPTVSPEMQEQHKTGGDIVVFLSEDQNHISWGRSYGPTGTFPSLVAMRPARILPLSLPNVGRNTVAHELGHVLGLRHNADDSTLMCGRPAACRPALFESPEMRFFPLTEDDRATLRQLHGGPNTLASNVGMAQGNADEAAIRALIAQGETLGLFPSTADRVLWTGAFKKPVTGGETGVPIPGEGALDNRVPGSTKARTDLKRIVIAKSGDMAYEYSEVTVSYDLKTGKHMSFLSSALRVWQKEAGHWRVAAMFQQPHVE